MMDINNSNKIFSVFLAAIRLGLILLGVYMLIMHRTGSALMCLLTLGLSFLSPLLRRIFRLYIPSGLELLIILFSIAANIGGEVFGLYNKTPLWDLGLHIIWGFAGGAVGYGLILIINKNRDISPLFSAVFCLCLSMSTALLWEFFEYFMDSVFYMDMQKDCYVKELSSVLLNPEGENTALRLYISSVLVNGELWPAYIDLGLIDTMTDLLVNFIGALAFSLLAWLGNKKSGLWRLLRRLIPSGIDKI